MAVQALRDHELRRVLERLASAGIRCVLMKGAALAYTHYRSPHLRPRSDTDLLIPPDSAARVATVLSDAGYERAVETSGQLATFQQHFSRPGGAGTWYALDVHSR